MGKKIRILVQRPYIAYPGSTVQQNYAEDRDHGYLLWDIKNNRDFDVNYHSLPNPKPFITLSWQHDLETTLGMASDYPSGSRFRIKSDKHIVQKDIAALTNRLKREFNATEVTFKQDHKADAIKLDTGTTKLIREDLRNPEILVALLKDYFKGVKISDDEWLSVKNLVSDYTTNIPGRESVNRCSKWSLRHLKFDNTYNFNEGNIIDFEKLKGIIGIFGPNRSGKSSIVGTIMYALFNASDRGSIKNKDICNSRKQYCYSRAIVKIGGTNYVIERQTAKQETKFNDIYAPTSLNLFRIDGDEAVDLAGEQRTETEKIVRNLLGSAEDFTLTSLAAQGDVNQYIQRGSTSRRQALSRFLDLDVCWQIFDQAKQDVNVSKALLKKLPERNYTDLISENQLLLKTANNDLLTMGRQSRQLNNDLSNNRSKLMGLSGSEPITEVQVIDQTARVEHLLNQINTKKITLDKKKLDIQELEIKLDKINTVLGEHDIESLNKRYSAYQQLKSSIRVLKSSLDKENETLSRQRRSLKILDEVPCGNMFPTCKFIKDAHNNLSEIDSQVATVSHALLDLKNAQDSLNEFSIDEVLNKIDKLGQLEKMQTTIRVNISELKIATVQLESTLSSSLESLESSRAKLLEYEEARNNEENEVAVQLRHSIENLEKKLSTVDNEKLNIASLKGRYESKIEQLQQEYLERQDALQQMKVYEIVFNGFSKKGIPNLIVGSQLPVINAEMAQILNGVVDFTIEMEREGEGENIEIYINYGDSRRIIELGSGMEKFIASIAMRVAMINISTLPKPDMFIVDEGFGTLDDLSIESCNRLLVSLKHYFRTIIVITHVDAIKDAADHIIEVTKNEIDSHVEYI